MADSINEKHRYTIDHMVTDDPTGMVMDDHTGMVTDDQTGMVTGDHTIYNDLEYSKNKNESKGSATHEHSPKKNMLIVDEIITGGMKNQAERKDSRVSIKSSQIAAMFNRAIADPKSRVFLKRCSIAQFRISFI